MFPELILSVVAIALILEFFDASLGQGYGTLTPILLLMGFAPLQVVPAVIFSSAFLSMLTGILHHGFGNVDFGMETKDTKIALVLTVFGFFGVLLAVFIAVHIPEMFLKAYIGAIITLSGIMVLARRKMRYKFSWKKILIIGPFAAFNQGMTGGGFGPVLSSGQIVSGIKSKSAVSITALVEGIISAVGVVLYFEMGGLALFNWPLIFSLLIGGLISTPVATYTVSKLKPSKLKNLVGLASVVLGAVVLVRLFF